MNNLCFITINILDFDYINLDKFHTKFYFWEDEAKDYMLTDLELPKFNKLEEKLKCKGCFMFPQTAV